MNLRFSFTHFLGLSLAMTIMLTSCGKSDDAAPAPPSQPLPPPPVQPGPSTSFGEFDRKAQAGQPLNVVFFGGSLTWGANASDPNLTSCRGLMGQYLRDKYPKSSFMFYDAAIGGTGSKLGMFRLERDVLSRHPDLVFYDFTANDGYDGSDPKSLGSYEGILRDMISKGIPVFQCYFGFKFQFGPNYHPDDWHGYQDRLKLAQAYHTGVGDVFPYIQDKLTSGAANIDVLWSLNHGKDGAHPDDPGYKLFFEAVRNGFEQAIKDNVTCIVPDQPVFSDEYHNRTRYILVDHDLPAGWTREITFRTSAWYDGLTSRWMGDVAVCDVKNQATVAPLKMDFTGTFVAVFGEMDENGMSFKALIDGKPAMTPENKKMKIPPSDTWVANGKAFKGRLFFWRQLSDSLAPGKHTLEIDPIFPTEPPPPDPGKKPGPLVGQLRIESICYAGE